MKKIHLLCCARPSRTRVATQYPLLLLALVTSLLIAGCTVIVGGRFPKPSEEQLARQVERLTQVPTSPPAFVPVSSGSLWPRDDHVFFYGDKKAFRMGDILTIEIVENATASNTADTDLSRKSSLTASLENFFGKKKFLGLFKTGQEIIKSEAENSHVGAGATSRKGEVTARISALVKRVLPNGNLVVEASRTLVVNQEEQFITLTGIVRPEDISRENVVFSTQVADATITITGTGVVADKQRSGWGAWIFDWVWPF
ncbi:MAG: flagellar basal body L-ring protein FlgH [Deltaproteobacteria bacterium]|nr:flagellar basal body L-ring protein FlgH [Deltaproteobacteria bacterium]